MGSNLPPLAAWDASSLAAGRRIAGALGANRHEAALHLLNSISDWPRWRADIAASTAAEGSVDFIQPLFVFIDYLSLYFTTADALWKQLYVGEKLKLLHEPRWSAEISQLRREQLAADDHRGLLGVFRRKLSADDFAELERGLGEITAYLGARPRNCARVLLIGDFLQLDVLALLYAGLVEEQIALEPTCLANADRTALHAAITSLSGQAFDFVFYTPLSDLDSPAMARLHGWQSMLTTGQAARDAADESARQVIATLGVVQSHWSCPIVIDNAAGVARHHEQIGTWLRNGLTRRVRRQFCAHVNRQLGEYVARSRQAGGDLSVFDEQALLSAEDEWVLGRMLHSPLRQYPIHLGRRIAEGYRNFISARLSPTRISPQQLIAGENRPVGTRQTVHPLAAAAFR